MIERGITPRVLAALNDTPVVLLVGARQTGKSTLVRHLADLGHEAEYVTLDDPTVLAAAKRDPSAFVDQLAERAIIDEVQRAPELLPPIKLAVDQQRLPGRFVLTGSANVLLEPTVADALTGRMEVMTLWPLSAREIAGRAGGQFVDSLLGEKEEPPTSPAPLDRAALTERIVRGGYPEAVFREDPERRASWFANYLGTILERDVRGLADIERLEQLPAVLASIATRSRAPLNKSGLSQDLGIPNSTIDRYVTLLERVFLVYRAPAWAGRVQRRLTKAPKLLPSDTGLMCHLLGLDAARLEADSAVRGPVLETHVGMELVKDAACAASGATVSHFKTPKGAEIDFILESPRHGVAGIEVKHARTVGPADFSRFERLRADLGGRFTRGVVIYAGDRVLPFGDRLAAWPISLI